MVSSGTAGSEVRDGRADFDFLIGEWKVHLKRLPKRLVGSSEWIEYEGTSRVRKIWDDCANAEEFEVDNREQKLHIKGQTLRLYNPTSGQWSIYLVDAANGILSLPPVVGGFAEGRGEFYDQEEYQGRSIWVRYVWTHDGPKSARMVQSFSADWGKSWEANWICDLTRIER